MTEKVLNVTLLKASLAALSTILLGGCISFARYPEDWPAPERKAGTCAALSGTYANFGEQAAGTITDGGRSELSVIFGLGQFPKPKPYSLSDIQAEAKEQHRSAIAPSDGGLVRIEVGGGDRVQIKLVMHRVSGGEESIRSETTRTPVCRDGVLSWGAESLVGEERGDPIVGPHAQSYEAWKGADGFLYVKYSAGEGGSAYFLLPMGYYGSSWSRFAPAM
jgi:hypothetical protein